MYILILNVAQGEIWMLKHCPPLPGKQGKNKAIVDMCRLP
jgi:hypothetical protein